MKTLTSIGVLATLVLLSFVLTANAQKRRPIAKPTPALSVKRVTAVAVKNCPASGLTDAEVADILAAHNKERNDVKVPALFWDCTLSKAASTWVAKGIAGHSETPYGENVFVSSDSDDKVTKAVDKWQDEHHHWNNKNGTCDAGKTCTHYAQIVWRRTTRIGCAVNRSAPGKWRVILVCNYDPQALSGPAY
jgi:pathogenesis-related protein 1